MWLTDKESNVPQTGTGAHKGWTGKEDRNIIRAKGQVSRPSGDDVFLLWEILAP